MSALAERVRPLTMSYDRSAHQSDYPIDLTLATRISKYPIDGILSIVSQVILPVLPDLSRGY